MELRLNGIDVDCIIGELEHERHREQRLVVDVRLTIDDGAAHSDRLEDTVDYAELVGKIRRALVEAKCRMIERAAMIVHAVCLAEHHVTAAQATVTKFEAVEHLKSASAVFG